MIPGAGGQVGRQSRAIGPEPSPAEAPEVRQYIGEPPIQATRRGQTDRLTATITFLPADSPSALDGELDPLETGDEFLDRIGSGVHVYDFESFLGAGGMGRVYLARHGDLGRRCAVKLLSPRVARSEVDYVRRFQQEGRAAAALTHPNVVVTHAIGEDRGFHFLEMEYVPGGTLRQLVRDEGPLPPLRATHLVQRIAEGLAGAHRRGIVHRDLKSENVMLTLAGVPKISDFGLAKRIRTDEPRQPRSLAGTPSFMAPELFAGEPASPASDVYALGVIYFELLTGKVPYAGQSLAELRHAVRHQSLPSARDLVDDLPLEMAEALALMLEKCPGNRPANGAAAAGLLAAVAGNIPDLETLLRRAFAGRADVSWTHEGTSYTLQIALADGRRQSVHIGPEAAASSEILLRISSTCGPADPDYYQEALTINGIMPHGCIAIQDIDGRPMFCAVNTYPRETADPEEVRRSVFEIARRADAIEHLLTAQDRH